MGDDSLWSMFLEEVEVQSQILYEQLLLLEQAAQPETVLEALMRAAHSLKGAARIVEATKVTELAHVAEDVFVAAQQSRVNLHGDAIDALITATDAMVALAAEGAATQRDISHELAALRAILDPSLAPPSALSSPATSEPAVPPTPPPADTLADFSLNELFLQEAEGQLLAMSQGLLAIESGEAATQHLESLMRAAHSLKGAARIVDRGDIVAVAHALEDLFIRAQNQELQLHEVVVTGLLSTLDWLAIASAGPLSETSDTPDAVLEGLRKLESAPADSVVEAQPPVAPAPAESRPAATSPPKLSQAIRMTAETLEKITGMSAETLVESGRIERIVDELVLLNTEQQKLNKQLKEARRTLAEAGDSTALIMVDEALRTLANCMTILREGDEKLEAYSRRASQLAGDLSRETLASRMLPFGSILKGYPRLIRDLNKTLGKQARLQIDGEHTLIDREIIEKLDSAINHLVRNAMDHGLEAPDTRTAGGKSPGGVVSLNAFHQNGRLHILLEDDGKGIAAERLRQSVVEKGLVEAAQAQALSTEELYEFMFLPGFSTAAAVTDVSGRGVGLDAVRTMVQETGGRIALHSREGEGTRFEIELPVTRSVVRALLVRIAGELYAVPVARIEAMEVFEASDLSTVEGRFFLRRSVGDIALIPAAEILELNPTVQDNARGAVVVVREQDRLYGLQVDDFVGERDLLVRTLDARLGDVPDVAAISIDEDGSVVLILDVDDLVRNMEALISGGRLQRQASAGSAGVAMTRRILVVDDSLTVRQAEKQVLENAGFLVDVAVDGLEAWSAVRLSAYDLLVTDVDMPRMNGIELVRRIRQEERLADLPIIIVSYKDRDEDRLRGLEAGANYYLAKGGFEDHTLTDAVTRLIGDAVPPPADD